MSGNVLYFFIPFHFGREKVQSECYGRIKIVVLLRYDFVCSVALLLQLGLLWSLLSNMAASHPTRLFNFNFKLVKIK